VITGHLIIIGAMKAGTTTLSVLMRRHPNVLKGPLKEMRYFGDEKWRGPEGYVAAYPDPPKDRDVVTLDASPIYAKIRKHRRVPERIAQLTLPVHLVMVLRDPVARAVSHVKHNLGHGRLHPAELGDKPHDNIVHSSLYSEQVAAYEAAGLRDRLLLLDFEEVCADQGRVVARICEHCGIPPMAVEEPVHRNAADPMPADATARLDLDMLRAKLAGEGERMAERYGFEAARRWSV
jgi:hypothetical protein